MMAGLRYASATVPLPEKPTEPLALKQGRWQLCISLQFVAWDKRLYMKKYGSFLKDVWFPLNGEYVSQDLLKSHGLQNNLCKWVWPFNWIHCCQLPIELGKRFSGLPTSGTFRLTSGKEVCRVKPPEVWSSNDEKFLASRRPKMMTSLLQHY